MNEQKIDRAKKANRFIEVVAGCGRGFFAYGESISAFEVDHRGRIWFFDAYSQRRVYTNAKNGKWKGFTNGGTLRSLIEALRDYIRTGEPPRLNLGPWPEWFCDGDLWGYGDDMQRVRAARAELWG